MLMYTNSGKWIDVANPENIKPEDMCIEDLAKISRLARYGGLTDTFYSVGAHSLIMEYVLLNVCTNIGDFSEPGCLDLPAKIALLHDLTEVYYADMPYPVKQLFPEYEKLELRAFAMICKKFGIHEKDPIQRIKPLDKCMWDLEKPVLQDGRNFDVIYDEWTKTSLKTAISAMGFKLNHEVTVPAHKEFIRKHLCGGTDIIPEVENGLIKRMIKYLDR